MAVVIPPPTPKMAPSSRRERVAKQKILRELEVGDEAYRGPRTKDQGPRAEDWDKEEDIWHFRHWDNAQTTEVLKLLEVIGTMGSCISRTGF